MQVKGKQCVLHSLIHMLEHVVFLSGVGSIFKVKRPLTRCVSTFGVYYWYSSFKMGHKIVKRKYMTT